MIIARVIGGLGNQLFQYAMARALAQRHTTSLALDLRLFPHYRRHHGFELPRVFSTPVVTATPAHLRAVLGWRAPLAITRRLQDERMRLLRGPRYVSQQGFAFDAAILDLPDQCYVAGYWQSERFFSDHLPLIRQELVFRPPSDPDLVRLLSRIRTSASVSVHVRRGDYATDPTTHAFHGTLPVSYYVQAMGLVAGQVPTPTFFFFSDDIGWAQRELPAPSGSVFVSGAHGGGGAGDFYLMSACRHHIIANSSFSWWGAWLDSRYDKLVVAPRRWFATPALDDRDLVPVAWVRV